MSQKRITLPEDLYFAATIAAAQERLSLSGYVADVLTRERGGKASQPDEPQPLAFVDDVGFPEPRQPVESFRTLVATLPRPPGPVVEPTQPPKPIVEESPSHDEPDEQDGGPSERDAFRTGR
ncbi:MAG: hypothetical protein HOO96_38670 [Polyangiaceae bacterium]|nr:hypothetical protein [Polyangiaceae bacterium]